MVGSRRARPQVSRQRLHDPGVGFFLLGWRGEPCHHDLNDGAVLAVVDLNRSEAQSARKRTKALGFEPKSPFLAKINV